MAQKKLLLEVVSIIVLVNLATAADHTVQLPNDTSEKLFEFNISPVYSTPSPPSVNSGNNTRLVSIGRRGGRTYVPVVRSASTPVVQGGAISLSMAIGVGFLLLY
jgi:hypothetical protein